MLNTNILIALVCVTLLLIFIIYKITLRKKVVHSSENNFEDNQALNKGNKIPDAITKLTLQERIELSWKFLYEITAIVINKFSKEDVSLVNKCGQILLNNGGRYEHVIDLAINRTKTHTQSVEQTKEAQKTIGI